jgi:short-subunit dehydrogenase
LPEAAENIRSSGAYVIPITADLSTRKGVERLWNTIADFGRPVDVACINAGVGVGGQFWETDLEEELRMIELNCTGTVQLAKHVVRHMRELNAGKILFTASIAGEMVAPREAVYAATKAFVLSFAHSLRYELRETGITVTALQPGPTDTDFFHRAGMDDTKVGSEGKQQSQPDDVAKDGLDALFAGKDHVYAHSATTKLEGAVANLVPGSIKASMHENMAKPLGDK